MSVKLVKIEIPYLDQKVNAIGFLPDPAKPTKDGLAILTHGYTSHKASILNWPTRLVEEGLPAILFDLPGHFLGGFSEVYDFELFKTEAPKLFQKAYELMKEHITLTDNSPIVLGGHSLGSLLCLKAMESDFFKSKNTKAVCVGLGLPPEGVTHIFDTPFYKSTLVIREQLVSKALGPKIVFPWIKEEKENMDISGHRIHFITGEDDLVVGKDGTERFAKILERHGNQVTVEKPTKLGHHLPEMAAGYVKKYLKSEGII
ncbi:alpha/beta hydrolase family protein [Bacteriovorax sp. BSW11_IV]|uniref:alpha/beta hydrolase n=1 Tax=Bacteriovorax sp. BSW11_IV TaxID=1353529 RepID=UPI00038A069E|nr:alpha/beta fold hydrolase [Bacteriovorax sp. BSW11_IV]EQC44529.1 alpha/beta hydrolase family protein [Bacteriovorax sp. BSW11_IV]